MRDQLVDCWRFDDGSGPFLALRFLGQVVYLDGGYEDHVSFSASCAFSGFTTADALEEILSRPPGPFDGRHDSRHRVYRLPVRGHSFARNGCNGEEVKRNDVGEIVLSEAEGAYALRALRLHRLGWRPLEPFGGRCLGWYAAKDGRRIPWDGTFAWLLPETVAGRSRAWTERLFRPAGTDAVTRPATLAARGSDKAVDQGGEFRDVPCRLVRRLDLTLTGQDRVTQVRPLAAAFCPPGALSTQVAQMAEMLENALTRATRAEASVPWEDGPDERYADIRVGRPEPDAETLTLSLLERSGTKPIVVRVPTLELIMRLTAVEWAGKGARPVALPTYERDLVIAPKTALALLRFLT